MESNFWENIDYNNSDAENVSYFNCLSEWEKEYIITSVKEDTNNIVNNSQHQLMENGIVWNTSKESLFISNLLEKDKNFFIQSSVSYWNSESLWSFLELKGIEHIWPEEISKIGYLLEDSPSKINWLISELEKYLWDVTAKEFIKYYEFIDQLEPEIWKILQDYKWDIRDLFLDWDFNRILWTNSYFIVRIFKEIGKEVTIKNLQNYINKYMIQFKNQVPVNIWTFWNVSYDNWIPNKTFESLEAFKWIWRSLIIMPHLLSDKLWRNTTFHSYKERIDVNQIIWTIDSSVNFWWGSPVRFDPTRNVFQYAKKMVSWQWDFSTFDSDPIWLTKIQWPDGNFIYIVTTNWNHRVSAAKISELPYIDACVKNHKISELEIDNNEQLLDYQKRIDLWLIVGEIVWDKLIINNTLFDGAELPKNYLQILINNYTKLYPWSFDDIMHLINQL